MSALFLLKVVGVFAALGGLFGTLRYRDRVLLFGVSLICLLGSALIVAHQ